MFDSIFNIVAGAAIGGLAAEASGEDWEKGAIGGAIAGGLAGADAGAVGGVETAVDNSMLYDVVTGAAIGAGVAYISDQNIAAGAAAGGALGGLSSGTSYDVTDFSSKMASKLGAEEVTQADFDAGKMSLSSGALEKTVTAGDTIGDSLKDFTKSKFGQTVVSGGISGAANYYMAKKQQEQDLENQKELMDYQKEISDYKLPRRVGTPEAAKYL